MKNARVKDIIDAVIYEQINYERDNENKIKENTWYLKKEENDTIVERKDRADKKIV